MTGSTLISGKKGSGKSLLMIIFAYYGQNMKDTYLNFPNKLKNAKIVDLALLLSGNLENCNVFLDEAYMLLDCHNSSSKINQNLSYELYQIRHTDIDLFLAVIKEFTIEIRFRLEMDNLIKCYRVPDDLGINPEYFHYEFYMNDKQYAWDLPFEKAKLFFQYYNTKEHLNRQNMTNAKLKIIKETNPKLFVEMSVKIAKQIYNQHIGENITHDQIILDLQILNESELYEKNCFLLCKKWEKEKEII